MTSCGFDRLDRYWRSLLTALTARWRRRAGEVLTHTPTVAVSDNTCLRDKGFAVVHTPGRVRNPGHVSIVWPADDPLNRQDIPWPQDVVTAFNGCFNDSVEGTDR